MINILFPGRHHLLTDFQFKYLYRITQAGLKNEPDVYGKPIGINAPVKRIIFAVTSANHSNTRRNPLPFYLRSMALQDFASGLNVESLIYGVDDVGYLENFASYTIKRIEHESNNAFDMTPDNTVVLCSTPVNKMYEKLGFKILPAELVNSKLNKYSTELPWDIVEMIAKSNEPWYINRTILEKIHPASYKLWKTYNIGEKVKIFFNDTIMGEDGDITTSRDYNTYVRQMDEIAQLKYDDTAPYIKPGRIGDIGCAVGSWIKLACNDERFRESDFIGIEVARHLFDICKQRKHNGEFNNPFVFFSQKNAVTGLAFEENSMNTIHTSSLTHEIESYGSRDDLIAFIKNRYKELVTGGVWINRDVVGPENKNDIVYMKLNSSDGKNDDFDKSFEDNDQLEVYLSSLSTISRFKRFAIDFRKSEGYKLDYEIVNINNQDYIKLKLSDACEFMTKKDYTDNWKSEMHEKFCFWSLSDWKKALVDNGFKVSPLSKAYSNPWIVKNRYKGKVELFTLENNELHVMDYPVTNMLLVCEKMI